jgi:hypothetical protein
MIKPDIFTLLKTGHFHVALTKQDRELTTQKEKNKLED